MPFDPNDPYGLQNNGPQRQDIAQSWGAVQGPASAAPAAQPQAAPMNASDQARVRQGMSDAILGITPESRMRAAALSQELGTQVSPLTVQLNTRHIAGSSGRAAGYVPVSRQTQTSGTMAEPAVAEIGERGMARVALADTAAREAAAAEKETLRIQEDEAFKQYGTSREEYDAWEKSLDDRQRRLLDEMQGIADERVDPNRIFRDRGVVGSALSIVGDMLKSYAAARQGMQFASAIQSDIDRDIALQTDELERKKGQKNTELARLVDETGDLRQAQNELRAEQQAYAVARLSRLAREAQEPAMQAQFDAETAQASEALGNTLTTLRYGTQSKAETEAYQQAQAATAGRDVVDFAGVLADAQKQVPKEDRADVAALGDKRANADQVIATIDQIAAENGLVVNPETLKIESPDGVSGFGFFENRLPNGALTEQAKATRAKTASLVMSKVQDAFGAANPDQVKMLREQMLGSETEEDFRVAMNEALRQARTQIAQANAGRPANVVQSYEARLRDEMARSRKQATAKAEAQQRAIEADRSAGLAKGPAIKQEAAPVITPTRLGASGYPEVTR